VCDSDLLVGKLGIWQEYEGLTNKIHDLQMREQQLHEVLFDYQHAAAASAADADVLMMSDAGSQPFSMSPGAADLPHAAAAALRDDSSSSTSSKTPMRGIVRAYLPKKMTTVVSITLPCRTLTTAFVLLNFSQTHRLFNEREPHSQQCADLSWI